MSITVKPETTIAKLADWAMVPIMYLLQFPCLDRPQRTHRWNNRKLPVSDIATLDNSLFISVAGDQKATRRWWGIFPRFHMPLFGGWKSFVVLEPKVPQDKWYVGWIPGDQIGISQVQLSGQVKLLRGPLTVYFFGINEHGNQIELVLVGGGEVGKDKKFSTVQFL